MLLGLLAYQSYMYIGFKTIMIEHTWVPVYDINAFRHQHMATITMEAKECTG